MAGVSLTRKRSKVQILQGPPRNPQRSGGFARAFDELMHTRQPWQPRLRATGAETSYGYRTLTDGFGQKMLEVGSKMGVTADLGEEGERAGTELGAGGGGDLTSAVSDRSSVRQGE